MTDFTVLQSYLPDEWMMALERLTERQRQGVRELRVRRGEPLTLSTEWGVRYLCAEGLTALRQPGVVRCRPHQLAACVSLLCDESVYAYQEQLQQGFITLAGGVRVGVAGQALLHGQRVCGVRTITALCFRLPGRYNGCARGLLPYVAGHSGIHSALLVGEPASGKTTLLRDLAVLLAARGIRVTVVDERGELAGVESLHGCDVLQGYPKAVGVLQAVRCLSPQVILFDELGDGAEVEAVSACANAGVAVMASLHGDTPSAVACRPAVHTLIRRQVFDRWLFLEGRQRPGEVRACLCPEVRDGEIHWSCADSGGRDRGGILRLPSPAATGTDAGATGAGLWDVAAAAHLFCGPYGTAVAAVGGNGWRG